MSNKKVLQASFLTILTSLFPISALSEKLDSSTDDILYTKACCDQLSETVLKSDVNEEIMSSKVKDVFIVNKNHTAEEIWKDISVTTSGLNDIVALPKKLNKIKNRADSNKLFYESKVENPNILSDVISSQNDNYIQLGIFPPVIQKKISQVVTGPTVNPFAFNPKLILENPSFPNSPAIQLIGSPEKTKSISTPNEFVMSVLNTLDNDGNFNPVIAVDTLPYVLIRGYGLTLEDYRNSEFQRFLSNTKLSIATSKAGDTNGTVRAAVGLEFVLLNEGDPRMDKQYEADILRIQKELLDKIGVSSTLTSEEKLKLLNSSDSIVQEAQKQAKLRYEQQRMWTVALGQSWVSPTGRYPDLRAQGMGFWTTYRQGLGGNSQLLLHASVRNKERIQRKSDQTYLDVDTLVGGIRLQSGDENFRFSLESAYNRESQDSKSIDDYVSFGVGFEPRLYENTWLAIGFNATTGRQNGTDFQFMTNIKWNFNTGSLEK